MLCSSCDQMGLLGNLFKGREKVLPEHVEHEDDFRRVVLESDLPVLLDVWGNSCGPCKQLADVLVEVATRHAGRIRVAEISTSGDPKVLRTLKIRATPTVIVYENGEEVGRIVGFRNGRWFDEMIEAEFPPS